MYNKLSEQSKKEFSKRISKIYFDNNEIIDKYSERMITREMSKGEKSWVLFREDYISNTNYEFLFTKYYKQPYDKSILGRLQEKFPEPDFKCSATHVNYSTHDFLNPDSPDVNYYIVKVEWGSRDDCKCVLF